MHRKPTATHELAFFQVPVPRSGNLVSYLRGSPRVELAAAVYSGVDVIAVIDGTPESINAAYDEILHSGAPIASVERYLADTMVPGPSYDSRQYAGRDSCLAFVRCAIRTPDVSVAYATSALAELSGVVRLFPSTPTEEIVVEVAATGKRELDEMVMSAIQHEVAVVRSTRTYLAINGMRWIRDHADCEPHVFVSVARQDAAFVGDLRKWTEPDLRLWTFLDIPVNANWTEAVDRAIDDARQHLFIVSPAALDSAECQREFGRVTTKFDAADICLLLLPDLSPEQLPHRYQQRQCLSASDFFAYPRLLEWLRQPRP